MSQALLIDSDIPIDHLRKEQSALDYIQQEIDDASPSSCPSSAELKSYPAPEKGRMKPSDPFSIS